jgi:hypothetical protein
VTPMKSAVDTEQERANAIEIASGVRGVKNANNPISVVVLSLQKTNKSRPPSKFIIAPVM